MIIQRDIIDRLTPFLKRKEYLAIVGPRQAGKTTLLGIIKDYLQNTLNATEDHIQFVTFEDRRLMSQFDDDPLSFVRSYIPDNGNKTFYLMIDEFQYVRDGGQRLKLVYDTVDNVKIIITGSSSLDIKAQVGRYLVGRILTFSLYPFNFREFLRAKDKRLEKIYSDTNTDFIKWLFHDKSFKSRHGRDIFSQEMIKRFEEFSIWGGYPGVVLSKTVHERQKVLNDILNNYIMKDIKGLLELATEKNLLLLSQYLAAQAGNIVVYQNLSQAAQMDYRQMKKHLNILFETFICTEVRPFFTNRQKELSRNPKIFFYDMGFRNSLIDNMNKPDKRSDCGSIIENSVFIRFNELCDENAGINFWRTKVGAEVDFIIQTKGKIIPVEVKYSSFDKAKISRSFASFIETFSPKQGVILTKDYFGHMRSGKTKIVFMPVYYL